MDLRGHDKHMAYHPDLSPYEIHWLPKTFTSLAVGWLDDAHVYATGAVDQAVVDKLWAFCLAPMQKFRGYHPCQFCAHPLFPIQARHGQMRLSLGSTILVVLGKHDSLYVIPDLIYHYIVEHNYLPPQEFLDVLRESPAPEASEYQAIRNFYIQEVRRLREGLVKTRKP